MEIKKVLFDDYYTGLIQFFPDIYNDERGYFFESFNLNNWTNYLPFIQDNESCSQRGVIRGLHYQYKDADGRNMAQAKLVRVVKGSVIDIVLDLRKNSLSFGKVFYFQLNDKQKNQLYIPRGFAHGFLTLEDNTIFSYKCDSFYCKQSECGINILDPDLNIKNRIVNEFGIADSEFILSEKDKQHPTLKATTNLF